MITLCRANERNHERSRKQDVWATFRAPNPASPISQGFGSLELLDEERLPPGATVARHANRDTEILTYLREGAVAQQDSTGHSGVLYAGEFRRTRTGRGVRYREVNASRTDAAHIFRLYLRPSETGLEPSDEHKRFSTADRRYGLCCVASRDARQGSLRIHLDALLYSAVLDRGQHVAHELLQGRSAWLHIVEGEATLAGQVLLTGDGVGLTAERSVSFTARAPTEVLLLDLGESVPRVSAATHDRESGTLATMPTDELVRSAARTRTAFLDQLESALALRPLPGRARPSARLLEAHEELAAVERAAVQAHRAAYGGPTQGEMLLQACREAPFPYYEPPDADPADWPGWAERAGRELGLGSDGREMLAGAVEYARRGRFFTAACYLQHLVLVLATQ